MERIVFLDTNCYMHYRPIEELPWGSLVGGTPVRLILPRIVLEELDRQKDSHAQRKMRERVRGVLRRLEEWEVYAAPFHLQSGVTLEYVAAPPAVDLKSVGLDARANDNLLIASMLDIRKKYPDAEVTLVSHDSLPRFTAKSLGLAAMALPDDYRLPDALGESEKELRDLRRRLERYENARPNPKVVFSLDSGNRLRAQVRRPDPLATDAAEQKLREVQSRHRPLRAPSRLPHGIGISTRSMLEPPAHEFDRYNSELRACYEAYKQYLWRDWEHRQQQSCLLLRIELSVANEGSAPADDLAVHLHFPDGFDVYSEEMLPEPPEAPEPPVRPRGPLDAPPIHIPDFVSPTRAFTAAMGPRKNVSGLTVKKTDSYEVTVDIQRVKHGTQEPLPIVYVQFESFERARSFHADYTIHAANLPDPVKGELHVIVESATDSGE